MFFDFFKLNPADYYLGALAYSIAPVKDDDTDEIVKIMDYCNVRHMVCEVLRKVFMEDEDADELENTPITKF